MKIRYHQPKSGGAIREVIREVNGLSIFDDIEVKKFAAEGGYAERVARDIKLETSQLRKFFNTMKKIERDLKKKSWREVEGEFYLLEPRIAYATARGHVPQGFYELIKVCMRKVAPRDVEDEQKIKNSFKKFVRFVEAIVAYHRYHHPKT